MKKLFLIILCICLTIFTGCTFDDLPSESNSSSTSAVETAIYPKVAVEEDSITIKIGETYQLNPFIDIDNYVASYRYYNSSSCITVSNKGLVKGLIEGTAEILISASNIPNAIGKYVYINVIDDKQNQEFVDSGILKVYFIDVGQADCIFVMLPNNETLMIDAGLDYNASFGYNEFPSLDNIKKVLKEENITTINHVLISHNHADHYEYIPYILDNYNVLHVYSSGSTRSNRQYLDVLNAIARNNLKMEVVELGDKILNYKDLLLQVVATRKEINESDSNKNSVILRLVYKNNSFIFTGDAGLGSSDAEQIAIKSGLNLKADVLKVGHHGSSGSSGKPFLQKVQPKYAIITSANKTSTGHPHESALSRLENIGAEIYQTKNSGTILFTCDGINYTITTEK